MTRPSYLERQAWPDHNYAALGMLEIWEFLLDLTNAITYGFADCRFAQPGLEVNLFWASDKAAKIEAKWQEEYEQRADYEQGWTGAPPFSQLSDGGKAYLYSVLSELKKRKNPTSVIYFEPDYEE